MDHMLLIARNAGRRRPTFTSHMCNSVTVCDAYICYNETRHRTTVASKGQDSQQIAGVCVCVSISTIQLGDERWLRESVSLYN